MREFLRLLSNNSVYLPDALCSHVSQISLARHLMMIATTKIVSEKLSSLSLLEIGSWLGASTLAWSHGINRYFPNGGKILCVDPWNQYLDKVEIEQKVKTLKMDEMARLGLAYECFLHNISFAPENVSIRHFRGCSENVLPYLMDGSFDIIYIDGDHTYDKFIGDLEEANRLLKPEGIVCGDDLELQSHQVDIDYAILNKDRDFVKDPNSTIAYHPGITLGVRDFFGEVQSYSGFWLMRKTSLGYQKQEIEKAEMTLPSHIPDHMKNTLFKHLVSNKIRDLRKKAL